MDQPGSGKTSRRATRDLADMEGGKHKGCVGFSERKVNELSFCIAVFAFDSVFFIRARKHQGESILAFYHRLHK